MTKTLGLPERATLVVLATSDGTILASELKKTHGIDLKKPNRERLVAQGLVEDVPERRSRRLTLTDKGWRFLDEGLSSGVEAKQSKAVVVALFALLGALSRRGARLEQLLRGAPPQEPNRLTEPEPEPEPQTLDGRIADAYGALAREPGDWVPLRELRAALSDVGRGELDDVIRRMRRDRKLVLTLEDDQSRLTAADRKAALKIGSDDMHYLRIDGR